MLTQVTSAMLTQEGGTGSMLSMILPFVLLIAVFYFLLIRPENKKKKAAAKMRSELGVGDEITTIGGIVGTICILCAQFLRIISTAAVTLSLSVPMRSVVFPAFRNPPVVAILVKK